MVIFDYCICTGKRRWPDWAVHLTVTLREIRSALEAQMEEIAKMEAAVANLEVKVADAIVVFNAKGSGGGAADPQIAADLAEAKAALGANADKVDAVAKNIDDAFKTGFEPSQVA